MAYVIIGSVPLSTLNQLVHFYETQQGDDAIEGDLNAIIFNLATKKFQNVGC
jgi:hypothetical protein